MQGCDSFALPGVEVAGLVVGGYEIIAELGRGGMAAVLLARHPRLPRNDALKLLHPGFGADPELVARFTREAEVLASFDHPNIVTVYNRGVDHGRLWIAMEYVAGVDAARLVSHGPIRPVVVSAIISGVASGLDLAHRRGIIHRDVKPANILLVPGGPAGGPRTVKLTDFGIARIYDDAISANGTTGTVGTLRYASPEQIEGGPCDHRSDIYALGVTAFELLTGTSPFDSSNQQALIAAHLMAPPPPVSERNPGLPSVVDAVVARAMAKDPGDRFDFCDHFAQSLAIALGTPLSRNLFARDSGAPREGDSSAVVELTTRQSLTHRPLAIPAPDDGPPGLLRPTSARETPVPGSIASSVSAADEDRLSSDDNRAAILARWLSHWWPAVLVLAIAAASGATFGIIDSGGHRESALAAPRQPQVRLDADSVGITWPIVPGASQYELRRNGSIVYLGSNNTVRQPLPLAGTYRYAVAARAENRPGSAFGKSSDAVTVPSSWGALTPIVAAMANLLPASPSARPVSGLRCYGMEGSLNNSNPAVGQIFCRKDDVAELESRSVAYRLTVAAYADSSQRDQSVAPAIRNTPHMDITTRNSGRAATVYWRNARDREGGEAYLVFHDRTRSAMVLKLVYQGRTGVEVRNIAMRLPL